MWACCSLSCDFPSCSRLMLHRIFCRACVVSGRWIRMSWTPQNISNSTTGLNRYNWPLLTFSCRLKPIEHLSIKHKGRWEPPSVLHLGVLNPELNSSLCLLSWIPSWELVPGILSSSPGFTKKTFWNASVELKIQKTPWIPALGLQGLGSDRALWQCR